jgi:type IV pilus assembly protein PilB
MLDPLPAAAPSPVPLEQLLAQRLGLPFIRLEGKVPTPASLAMVPAELAYARSILPLEVHGDVLRVALADPADADTIHLLQFLAGKRVQIFVAARADLDRAIAAHYGDSHGADLFEVGKDEEIVESTPKPAHPSVPDEQRYMLRPIVRLVSHILTMAVRRAASDIHIRPGETDVELVFRIDGVLVPIRTFSQALLPMVVGRIKILAGMDITERRLPQDGQARIGVNGRMVDLRISSIPTLHGESVVIRLLNTSIAMKSIADLGLSPQDAARLGDACERNQGMVLVTGPTGSGKSTTLYAALNTILQRNVNIITVENPVEYHIPGVEQVPINADVGLTFSRVLRNILRHDPDVIMVGEIRDQETAKIAVESALTGHLLLSTLHTNSAAATIARLLEMEVEAYLIRATLLCILSQRLVRLICPACKAPDPVDPSLREALSVGPEEVFYAGRGCPACNGTGTHGRRMTYELLFVTPAMRQLVVEEADADAINAQAEADGMVPLPRHALALARQGLIPLHEAYRMRVD